jgi:hypothetical protein
MNEAGRDAEMIEAKRVPGDAAEAEWNPLFGLARGAARG